MQAFGFLPSLDRPIETQSQTTVTVKKETSITSGTSYKLHVLADELARVDSKPLKGKTLVETSKEFNTQFWQRMPFSEVGIIRGDRIHIKIKPFGYRKGEKIASIQYRVDQDMNVGDFDFAYSTEWHDIGSLTVRKGRVIFFLDKTVESMSIGCQTLLKERLKQCGFIHTDCMKGHGIKYYDCHPMLDKRLHKLLRLSLKACADGSKPFEVTTDTRELDPCVQMKPSESVSTFVKSDSRRSSAKIRVLARQVENLQKQNESQQIALEATRRKQVATLSNSACKQIDQWYKVDKASLLRLERKP